MPTTLNVTGDSDRLANVIREHGGGLFWGEIPDPIFNNYQFRNPAAPQVHVSAVTPGGQRIKSWIPLSVFDQVRQSQDALLIPSESTAQQNGNGENEGTGVFEGVATFLNSFFEGYNQTRWRPDPMRPTTGIPPRSSQAGGTGQSVVPLLIFGGVAAGIIYFASQEPNRIVAPPPGPPVGGGSS